MSIASPKAVYFGSEFDALFSTPRIPRSRKEERRESAGKITGLAQEHLMQISAQTGGRMFAPADLTDLSIIYAEIADYLGSLYQLAYTSTNRSRDRRWREIRVEVKDSGLVVRKRKGYYATGPEVARPDSGGRFADSIAVRALGVSSSLSK